MIAQISLDMSVSIGSLPLRNPVMLASGTCGYGVEMTPYLDLSQLGAVVVKGTTLRPRLGNPPPRIAETPAGMLNSIGLQNVGVERLISEKLPALMKCNVPIIVNVSGDSLEDFIALVERLDKVEEVAALELNISCPNLHAHGSQSGRHRPMLVGQDPESTEELVTAVRKRTRKPLIVKLTPNVTDIADIAQAAARGGADAVSLINTLLGMAIDVESRRSVLANVLGGLSGPAVRPVAVRMVWDVARAVKIPIVGMGGICSASDALEFLIAGATAVAVGSASFVNPLAAIQVVQGIREYLVKHRMTSVQEVIGSLVLGDRNV